MAHITEELTLKEKKKLKAREEVDQQNFDDAIKFIGSDKNGREFLWKVLQFCKPIGQPIFNPHSLTQSYLAGKQDVGNWLLGEILRVDEEIYLKAMQERRKERE